MPPEDPQVEPCVDQVAATTQEPQSQKLRATDDSETRPTEESESCEGDGWAALIAGVDAAGQAASSEASAALLAATAPGAITTEDVFHLPTKCGSSMGTGAGPSGAGGAAGSSCCSSASEGTSAGNSLPALSAKIVATCNQLEEEPWLPVRSIVTMFRIQVTMGDQNWELLRRYSDFHELDGQLAKSFDPDTLPPLPPKLMVNEDAAIASRFLELDVYVRALLAHPTLSRHPKVHDFLGVEKQGARYGVRRYEYDSAQSEGNRYIRDNDL